jgi:transposase
LQRNPIGQIPAETVRIVHAAFWKGTLCMRLRDTLGTISTDDVVVDVFSSTGRPTEAPWRLALVSILPYIEDLADRQAAAAVRARIDWTYVLGLERTDSGVDFSILSDVRAGLMAARARQRMFEHL